ncbi:MAG: preprotein translocase subunit YajC [Phycisphaerales bacterium]
MSHTVILAPAAPVAALSLTGFAPSLAQQTSAPPVAGQGAGETTGADGSGQPLGPSGQAPPPSPFGGGMLLIFVGFFMLLILMQVFGGRKQKKQREQMLSSLARHDRVQTIGGVIATVAEVRDNEVVLKVDEATNTKVRFARSSIQQILKKAGDRGEASPAEEPEMANA